MRIFAALAFTALLSLVAPGAQAEGTQPLIAVTGEGSVSVVPDLARISIGVTHQGETAAAAVAMVSEDMTRVLANLDAAGILPADIQTGNLRVDLQQDFNSASGTPTIIGYMATNEVNVTVRAIDKLGETIDAVVQDGANQINSLAFDVADRAPYLLAARQAAVVDASAKAQVFAQAANVGVGALQALTEGGTGAAPIMMRQEAFSADTMPVAAGEITITAQVTMIFAIAQ